jgi:hypothetical protein
MPRTTDRPTLNHYTVTRTRTITTVTTIEAPSPTAAVQIARGQIIRGEYETMEAAGPDVYEATPAAPALPEFLKKRA